MISFTDLEEMVSISKASDAAKGGDSDATDVDAEVCSYINLEYLGRQEYNKLKS